MKSIIQKALGSDFEKLHPNVQKRFALNSEDGLASMCTGVMEEIWNGGFLVVPSLYIASFRRIMFSATGKNVPFTLGNYPFKDKFDREAVLWVRKFSFPDKERRFDTTMIYSDEKGKLIDYMGSHQQIAVEIEAFVSDKGGFQLRSGDSRFYEGILGFKMPASMSAVANGHAWYEEDEGRYRVKLVVSNDMIGPVYGYSGYYECEYFDIKESGIPKDLRPVREERRE